MVSGVSSGIGAAVAESLLGAGRRVIGLDISEPGSQHFASCPSFRFGQADVRDTAGLGSLLCELLEPDTAVSGLVNCAGIYEPGDTIETISEADWDRTLDVNLKGTFNLCRLLVPHLKIAGGSIVNIASVHAIRAVARSPAYAASKGAVLAFTRQIAMDLAIYQVRANALLVGAVDTGLTRHLITSEKEAARRGLSYAPGQIGWIAPPSEVAKIISFLLSDDSRFINAAGIVADAGLSARLIVS